MQTSLFGKEEKKTFTVSSYLDYINELLDVDEDYTIQGEITGLQQHPSGIYLSLKDHNDGSILNCYIYPRLFYSFGLRLEDGMQVKVTGTSSIYKAKGRLSFSIKTLELAGEGSLKKAYELLKKQLESEGLFARKRELPEFIQKIGIITSRTGAVIDDFRKNLAHLGFELYLYDARVEGDKAVNNILSGIKLFNQRLSSSEIDILVIMRGGGSLEDLQAFNNELIARAIFASGIPTICAIGHDRDLPIATLVSDAATSTPTAAAILINKSWGKLTEDLPMLQERLLYRFRKALSDQQHTLQRFSHGISEHFSRILNRYSQLEQHLLFNFQKLADLRISIYHKINALNKALLYKFGLVLNQQMTNIKNHEKYLENANPERALKLGYSIVRDSNNKIVKSAHQLNIGDTLTTHFHDGSAHTLVKDIIKT